MGYRSRTIYFLTPLFVLLFIPTLLSAYESDLAESARSLIQPPSLKASSWLLMDSRTGTIIASEKKDKRIEPASLSKLMTAYVVFQEIQRGIVRLDEEVTVSEKAWKTMGSRMFIEPGDRVRVEDLLLGLIVQSGNDAAVALAEHVAGSEAGFADLMNQAAVQLGLKNTHFVNSTGLPHPDHFSTAYDISEVTRTIIRQQPEHYGFYAISEFTWNGITQKNRNPLLARDDAVDGVKTGHTKSAGYCLVGSAERKNMRLIASVMGASSERSRANSVYSLLKYGFAAYEFHHLYGNQAAILQADIFKSKVESIPVGISQGIDLLLPKGSGASLQAKVQLSEPLVAPLEIGQEVGTLTILLKNAVLVTRQLIALGPAPAASWFGGLTDSLQLWLR